MRLDDWQLEVDTVLEKVTVSDYSDPRSKSIMDNGFRVFVGAGVPHWYLIDQHQQRIGWVRLDNEEEQTHICDLEVLFAVITVWGGRRFVEEDPGLFTHCGPFSHAPSTCCYSGSQCDARTTCRV